MLCMWKASHRSRLHCKGHWTSLPKWHVGKVVKLTVRRATYKDLDQIANLAQDFGHLMVYMQTSEGIRPHIPDIIVKEEEEKVIGFFHCRPLEDLADYKFILKEKTIPDFLLDSAWYRRPVGICMQGGSHREVFAELIKYLQTEFQELWCWCSIKSRRPEGYKEFGFSFNPQIHYTFHNPHVDRESTYQLGRWVSE